MSDSETSLSDPNLGMSGGGGSLLKIPSPFPSKSKQTRLHYLATISTILESPIRSLGDSASSVAISSIATVLEGRLLTQVLSSSSPIIQLISLRALAITAILPLTRHLSPISYQPSIP